MAPAWSKYGPDMVLKIRHYIDNCLRPCWLSPENFRALASLEHTFPDGGAGGASAGAFGFYLV